MSEAVQAVEGLVTEQLLVMSFVDGFKVDDRAALESHGADRELIVRHVTRSYAHQVFEDGFFSAAAANPVLNRAVCRACQIFVDGFYSADPHPGNILVDTKTLRPVNPFLTPANKFIQIPYSFPLIRLGCPNSETSNPSIRLGCGN